MCAIVATTSRKDIRARLATWSLGPPASMIQPPVINARLDIPSLEQPVLGGVMWQGIFVRVLGASLVPHVQIPMLRPLSTAARAGG